MSKTKTVNIAKYVDKVARERAAQDAQAKRDLRTMQKLERSFKESAETIVQPIIDGVDEWRASVGQKTLGHPEVYVTSNPGYTDVSHYFNDGMVSRITVEFRENGSAFISAAKLVDGPAHAEDMSSSHYVTLASAHLGPQRKVPKKFYKQLVRKLLP